MSYQEVIESQIPVIGEAVSCCQCNDVAVAYWPGVVVPNDPKSHPSPYCQRHLTKARDRLSIAVGLTASR